MFCFVICLFCVLFLFWKSITPSRWTLTHFGCTPFNYIWIFAICLHWLNTLNTLQIFFIDFVPSIYNLESLTTQYCLNKCWGSLATQVTCTISKHFPNLVFQAFKFQTFGCVLSRLYFWQKIPGRHQNCAVVGKAREGAEALCVVDQGKQNAQSPDGNKIHLQ